MKTKTYLFLIPILMLFVLGLSSCAKKEKDPNIAHYTCPMHPQVIQDDPGTCPICHMDLVPVYKESKPVSDSTMPPASPGGVSISPDRQQLIGVKKAVVAKKDVVKELRTTGVVAYDPALAVAQREYIAVVQNVPSLKEAAASRLRLLGMSEEEIRGLTRKGVMNYAPTSLYLPGTKDSLWIYATLFEKEAPLIKPGQEATITLPGSKAELTGTVRSVDPVVNAGTRSLRARIELKQWEGLKPDAFVQVQFRIPLGENLVIPKSALIETGTRTVAFVVHGDSHFQPTNIKTGATLEDEVVVLEGLKEGETVVSSATFLVDSESQLKAAVGGSGHQH